MKYLMDIQCVINKILAVTILRFDATCSFNLPYMPCHPYNLEYTVKNKEKRT